MASIQKKYLVLAGGMLCFILIAAGDLQAQCVASGPNDPGTATSVSTGLGSVAFANPQNVTASDGNFTQAHPLLTLLSGRTQDLRAKNFGFAIPLTAIICGIEATVEKSAGNIFLTSYVTDRSVQLMKNGTVMGNDKAAPANWTTAETNTTYGNGADDWGISWTPNDINDPDFGISFSANIFDLASLLPFIWVDNIRITVYYYEPPLLSIALQVFNVMPGKDHSALLRWKTSEWNESIYFAVQRSMDNTSWETIAGFSQNDVAGQLYSYTDLRPMPGRSYYRLAMSYSTGEIKYSVSQSLVMPEGLAVHCYPNPFISVLYLTGVRAGERVLLTDVFGQQVALPEAVVNGGVTRLDVSRLRAGVYFVWAGGSRKKVMKR